MTDGVKKIELPDETPEEDVKKGFFQRMKEKIEGEHEEVCAVYGPAEWFEPKFTEPVDIYGPAEAFGGPADDPEDDPVEDPEEEPAGNEEVDDGAE